MLTHLKIAIKMAIATLVLLGLIYPLAITGAAQLTMRRQANGSLVRNSSGAIIGSSLIAQKFERAEYFHPRPSAVDYNAAASGGSNLGPTNEKLRERIATDVKKLEAEDGIAHGAVPVDAVTTSGSGLDPDITPANAMSQVNRVTDARSLSVDGVKKMIESHTTPRQFGVLGEPRVNVLELNLALDAARK